MNAAPMRNGPVELQCISLTLALSDLNFKVTRHICVRICFGAYRKIRGNALVSPGHLARRFHALDELTIKPFIEFARQDTDEYVRMSALSAANEIHRFLHWQITGHPHG